MDYIWLDPLERFKINITLYEDNFVQKVKRAAISKFLVTTINKVLLLL